MAQVRTSAATAIACPPSHGLVDGLATMGQLRQVQGMMHLALSGLFDAHQGYASGFGTGIKLQGDWLDLACLSASILEPDRERPESMHHRSFAREEQTRSSLRAGHQRTLALIQYKHGHIRSFLSVLPQDEAPLPGW
jgi:hypothetical protein